MLSLTDKAFVKRGFLIAKDSIRAREKDVASPQRLCKENLQYKNNDAYRGCSPQKPDTEFQSFDNEGKNISESGFVGGLAK